MPSNNNNGASGSSGNAEKLQEQITLSKRMFIAGCFGLPWLWICNVLYFRRNVYRPLVFVDYWPTRHSVPPLSSSNQDQQSSSSVDEQLNLLELKKWVKRSTSGAV